MKAAPGVPRASLWAACGSLLVTSSTLLCCVLPAALVAIGAGATLAGLVTAVPQLIWLSAHKGLVFGAAAAALALAGAMQWRARSLPCPADAALARACARVRRVAAITYSCALAMFALGALFAFVIPWIGPT